MLRTMNCNSCRRRCLQTLIGDSILLPIATLGSVSASQLSRRTFSRTVAQFRDEQGISDNFKRPERGGNFRSLQLSPSSAPIPAEKPIHPYKLRREKEQAIERREDQKDAKKQWLESRGVRPASKPEKDEDFVTRKHLMYLQDPVKLAEFVRTTLRAGGDKEFETVAKVVRTASKTTQCTVSWNHLIDFQLSNGRMNQAIKIYNEMKKRAQAPDSRTYTIIFRGCADHPDSKAAVSKALAIYHSMLLEKSIVKPNIIHTNAVLKVCARAYDMDALFVVAAKLPDSGPGAPNNFTYTTILNALRMDVVNSHRNEVGLTPMGRRYSQRQTTQRALHIWQDISKRWGKGDIHVDEQLVAAMGRLLVSGETKELDDVFSLVAQTMNIPRQIRRVELPEVVEAGEQVFTSPTKRFEANDVDIKLESQGVHPFGSKGNGGEDDANLHLEVFKSVTPVKAPEKDGSSFFAKPGNNTLSLLLEALLKLRMGTFDLPVKGPAFQYWKLFAELGVKPDAENYHAMLRILRVVRAGTDSIELLMLMPKGDMEAKTFKIAMSTIARDKNNPNSFANAGKLLDLMQMSLDVPYIPVLLEYLTVAIASPPRTSAGKSLEKGAQGRQILRALDRLGPSFVNVKSLLSYGDPVKKPLFQKAGRKDLETGELKINIRDLTRRMIAAYDLLMNKALVPRDQYAALTAQRAKLQAFLDRYTFTGERDGEVGGKGRKERKVAQYRVKEKAEELLEKAENAHKLRAEAQEMAAIKEELKEEVEEEDFMKGWTMQKRPLRPMFG